MKDSILEGHILNIIQSNEIAEQNELQEQLIKRGFAIPQATLSRKLKKLKIAKVSGIYKIVDFNQPHLPLILNIQTSDSGLIVLHTHPGQASSLAYYFDQKYVNFSTKKNLESEILGTIAGDDTVLLITKSKASIPSVLQSIQDEFPYVSIHE